MSNDSIEMVLRNIATICMLKPSMEDNDVLAKIYSVTTVYSNSIAMFVTN